MTMKIFSKGHVNKRILWWVQTRNKRILWWVPCSQTAVVVFTFSKIED